MKESNEEKKERMHLRRELKISELILDSKINELNNEKIKNQKLENDLKEIKNKNEKIKENIEEIKEQIEKQKLINEQIIQNNNNKEQKFRELYLKLQLYKPRPVSNPNPESKEVDEEIPDYEIIEI